MKHIRPTGVVGEGEGGGGGGWAHVAHLLVCSHTRWAMAAGLRQLHPPADRVLPHGGQHVT
jgi:hypothetical protein